MGNITVIGITDRGADSLTPEALALVEQAALLCGGERHLAFFRDHPAERFVIKSDLSALVRRLREGTAPAVVLASGDPGWYGIGPLLVEELGLDRVRILPNVSAAQQAFARLGLPWHDAVCLSAHGRPLEGILPQALFAPKAVILTDGRNTPAVVARALLDAGDEDAVADVFEYLDGPGERHVAGHLSRLLGETFAPLNVLIVRHNSPRRWPLGLPEELFAHHQGLITKAEVRAVSLAKLRLHEAAALWDVGAGCGSVAIEASALLRRGRVFAIERDPVQLEYLSENRGRFGAGNVVIVSGEAPAALKDLPRPDAVFVGGSGGQLREVLLVAMEALRPGGCIVANLVTLEHLSRMLQLLESSPWTCEVTQLSIARSTETAGLTRLAGLNPVFVVTARRKGEASGL